MTDDRQQRAPNPHLHTRPATMLTAIGLCVIIMLIQLVPEIQDASSRFTTASSSTSTAR
jgi:type II secretory pathway component PulF